MTAIDRDALIAELSSFIQDDDASDPLFSADEVTAIAEYQADRILALVRPGDGVTLTADQAATARLLAGERAELAFQSESWKRHVLDLIEVTR